MLIPCLSTIAQVRISDSYSHSVFKLPNAKNPIESFNLVPPGTPVLPIGGGAYIPELNIWLLEPGKRPIQSIDFLPESKSILLIIGHEEKVEIKKLYRSGGIEKTEILGTLTKGFYQIKAASEESYYIWGLNQNGWHIEYRKGSTVKTIFKSELPITSLTCSGENALLFSLPRELIMMTPNSPPKRILSSDKLIYGADFDQDGNIYISHPHGIVRFAANHNENIIGTGLRGKLVYHGGHIYLIDQELGQMFKIKLSG